MNIVLLVVIKKNGEEKNGSDHGYTNNRLYSLINLNECISPVLNSASTT